MNEAVKAPTKSFPKGVGKKNKKIASSALIKGQWTDEEDRKLIIGEAIWSEEWALIAEGLVGRAGKQCRERWHNHLRPDIKIGNRWRRSQIHPWKNRERHKNHWNATKRRQNSRKKIKQNSNQIANLNHQFKTTSEPKILMATTAPPPPPPSPPKPTVAPLPLPSFSEDLSSPSGKNPRTPSVFGPLLSRLLNGAPTASFPCAPATQHDHGPSLSDQSSSVRRNDMDLIEMVSSSQFWR
ncbi:hypothetical protein F3Y22_tig00116997pilonHSYRG00312 [Hibiscus syriacus]|uniref:Uncharacterized protein n=1 Tax=Hibiscus syriacus TaxID=106335 RepID=A0A6A2WE82_HIBSY|nr:hypothetical protein F3Y22_tig00116997pilonHSYRG00312 [Hibiscus syriacus]